MAEAGFEDEETWRHIKEQVVNNHRVMDAKSMIDLRNSFVKHRPDERAFISYLEMRTIGILYMFGKTNRSILYPGVSMGKKVRRLPDSL